jgi:hypothetical protein
MRHVISTLVLAVLLAAALAAQPAGTVHARTLPPGAPPPAADGATVLWDQSAVIAFGWADQAYTDAPALTSFQVCDVSTGGALWNVHAVSTYYSKFGAGNWSAASITTGSLNVFPKTGSVPVDATDVPPELTVPVTLTDHGGFWEVSADTSGVADLQGIDGVYWIGLAPITSQAADGQEFHLVVSTGTVGARSAWRNPLGGWGFGTGWVPQSDLDPTGSDDPFYEGSIRLQGDAVAPTWETLAETGVVSPTWGGVPLLSGSGVTLAGQPISLSGTFNGTIPDVANLLIGPALLAPFKGGVLVPDPLLIVPIPVGVLGDFVLPASWPGGIPPGTALHFQSWTHELPGPLGWSASDGLKVVSN